MRSGPEGSWADFITEFEWWRDAFSARCAELTGPPTPPPHHQLPIGPKVEEIEVPPRVGSEPSSAGPSSRYEDLAMLGKLRTDGVLTDEEFAEEKAKLLQREQ